MYSQRRRLRPRTRQMGGESERMAESEEMAAVRNGGGLKARKPYRLDDLHDRERKSVEEAVGDRAGTAGEASSLSPDRGLEASGGRARAGWLQSWMKEWWPRGRPQKEYEDKAREMTNGRHEERRRLRVREGDNA